MAEVVKYILVDRDDNEVGGYFDTMQEAIDEAGEDHAVVEHTYTFDDSELVWTPNGALTWPPKARALRGKGKP